MMKKYLEAGRITSPHGVRGEVKLEAWSDSPDSLIKIRTVFFDDGGKNGVKVENARPHKNFILLKLENVNDMDAANALRGRILFVDRGEIVKDEESYFLADLIGMKVKDADTKEEYGEIRDVIRTGANDVYELVDASGKERLVPAIKDVVISTDIEGGVMLIRPLEGLFE